MNTPVVQTAAGIGLLWLGAAGLASRLPSPAVATPEEAGTSADMVTRLFGSGREIISEQLYREADRYFHNGVGGVREKAFTHHPYLRWAEAITPTEHTELEGDGVAEIMPWLSLATRADPANIKAYTTAAFWLGTQNDVEGARTVLAKARRLNPGDYRISLALGQLLYRKQLLDEALVELEQARAEWPSGQGRDDRQTRLDLAAILSVSAGIHELHGHHDETIARFREILTLFPNRNGVRERLAQLEGGALADDAAQFWDGQLNEITAAGDGSHVAGGGGGHVHGESCGHAH